MHGQLWRSSVGRGSSLPNTSLLKLASSSFQFRRNALMSWLGLSVNPKAMIISLWTTVVFSKTTLFAVRMSILYSIIRIIPQCSSTRTVARIVGIFFVLFWATSIILKASTCKLIHTAKLGGIPPLKCTLVGLLAIYQMTSDLISDAILVILPLKLLWRVKLPRRQRRMILTLFTSSAVVSIFSLAHSTFQLFPRRYVLQYTLTYNLEMMSSLFVCNLLVVVTCVYRAIRKSRDGSDFSESEDSSEDDDDFTTRNPARRTTEALTTVDLDIAYSGVTGGVPSSLRSHSVAAEKSRDTGDLN